MCYKEKKARIKNLIKDEEIVQRDNVLINKHLYVKEALSIKLNTKKKTNLLRNWRNVIRHTKIIM